MWSRTSNRLNWLMGGIMGLGTLGADAAEVLRRLGFRVVGWSRSPKQIEGVGAPLALFRRRLLNMPMDRDRPVLERARAAHVAAPSFENHVNRLLVERAREGGQRFLRSTVDGDKGGVDQARMDWIQIRTNPEKVRKREARKPRNLGQSPSSEERDFLPLPNES